MKYNVCNQSGAILLPSLSCTIYIKWAICIFTIPFKLCAIILLLYMLKLMLYIYLRVCVGYLEREGAYQDPEEHYKICLWHCIQMLIFKHFVNFLREDVLFILLCCFQFF